jgi:hypothetical protein
MLPKVCRESLGTIAAARSSYRRITYRPVNPGTSPYDRRGDAITLDAIERIGI